MRAGAAKWVLAWCLALLLGGWWSQQGFQITADLRSFMPPPRTEAQRLLLQNVGESPASRLLILALRGDEPARLASLSTQLAEALSQAEDVAFIANGTQSLAQIDGDLLAYRYLITDSFDDTPLDASRLSAALQARAEDLSSPAAGMIEELLPRDPTLETLHLLERWQPRQEPRRIDGAWFTADGQQALLLLAGRAAAFDPDGQAALLARVRAEFDRVRGQSGAQLTITGSGYFSATIKQAMQREASAFGVAATLGLVLLMGIAYRRASYLLLAALPLLTGGLLGLALVGSLFDSIHGITLAFGFTLLGVAQDYPVHLFSHLTPGRDPRDTARGIARPLLTGVFSTCIAYITFLVSGVTGLAQLACLTITGLAAAALLTRFVLPALIAPPSDATASPLLQRLDATLLRLPRLEWIALPLLAACAAALYFARGPFWQDDLSRLTPVAPEALRLDADLRRQLATPDLRYLLVVSAADEDAVLTRLESLEPRLRDLQSRGILAGYEHAARYLPSEARQRGRQAALPSAEAARLLLAEASRDAGFADGVFEPFLEDLQRARELPPLRLAQLLPTALGTTVGSMLFERQGQWHGLVSFQEIRDAGRLERELGQAGAVFLDLKGASQELVTAHRAHILQSLWVAAAALALVVWLALRRWQRACRVLAPMLLTTLIILAVLRASGVQLNLFHLISMVLAAGLGLDYALFFEHAGNEGHQQRTLHALLVCSISTLLVFALLALSSSPVLQAIGVTVTIGVISNFLLALALSRARPVHE